VLLDRLIKLIGLGGIPLGGTEALMNILKGGAGPPSGSSLEILNGHAALATLVQGKQVPFRNRIPTVL
jgi:hypothetical protein